MRDRQANKLLSDIADLKAKMARLEDLEAKVAYFSGKVDGVIARVENLEHRHLRLKVELDEVLGDTAKGLLKAISHGDRK